MSIENVTMAFQNAATTGEGLTQFLELLHSGTYYDFIDLNVAGLRDRQRLTALCSDVLHEFVTANSTSACEMYARKQGIKEP